MRRACDTHAALQQIRSAAPPTNRRSAAPNALPRTRIIRAESQRTCRSHRRPTCLNTGRCRSTDCEPLESQRCHTGWRPSSGRKPIHCEPGRQGRDNRARDESTIPAAYPASLRSRPIGPCRCEEAYRSTAVRANRLTMAMQKLSRHSRRIGMRLLIFAGVTLVHLLGLAWVFAHAPSALPLPSRRQSRSSCLPRPDQRNGHAAPSADPAPRPARAG